MTRLRKSAFNRSVHNRLASHTRSASIAVSRLMFSSRRLTRGFLFGSRLLITLAALAGSLLALQPSGTAEEPAQKTTHARREVVVPMVTGTDGSQTGTAAFFGNFTTISTPSGALSVFRETNCSLTLATGTYTIHPNFAYSQTQLATNYERVLHSQAQLSTTPDVFAKGCALQPTPGFGSRPGVFVGTTTTGVSLLTAIGLTYPAMVEGVYLLKGDLAFTLSSFQDSTAGLLTAADLNKDGNGDLVIVDNATASVARVTVMLGNADGTLQNGVVYPIAGNYSVAAVIDDVNGDGKLDIVAVSGDQQISVLLGNGDGTFKAAQSFAAPALPGQSSASATPIVNMITADLRGVGKKDIVCSNGLVLLGNGDGTFAAAAAPAFPYSRDSAYSAGPNLASGDLNNDGKIDLVVNNGNAVSTWIGKADGSFTQGPAYTAVNTDGFVAVDDLDGDGNADIFVGLGDGGTYGGDIVEPGLTYALMGNGNGTFQGAPAINSGAYSGNNLVDLNGDGVPDLVTMNTGSGLQTTAAGSLTVQLGNGKGAFTQGANITPQASFSLNGYNFTMGTSALASSFATGDVNGDGKPDVVFVDNNLTATNPGSGFQITYPYPVYFVALGNGDGTFQTAVPHAFPQIAASTGFDNTATVTSLEIADFNHDGHTDLIFVYNETAGGTGVNPYNQGLIVLPGNGDGTFKAPVLTSTYSSSSAPTTAIVPQILNVMDLNGDNSPDLVVNAPGTTIVNFQLQTQLEVFLSNGDGTFKAPTTVGIGADAYGTPVLADFNKDSKLDLAVLAETSAGQAELAIALGNGNGTFASATISNLGGGDAVRSAGLAGADFDGDGNADLALLDSNDYSGIFYGKGDGTFTSVPLSGNIIPKDLISISAGAPAVAADLNKDGKPDILAGGVSLLNITGATPTTLASTTTALVASQTSIAAGTSVKFTATVTGASGSTGTPTGTVTFMDGTATLGTGILSAGVATYTTSSLAVGSHSITAAYPGDSNFSGSTSTAVPVTVTVSPGFVVGNSGNITVAAGATTGNTSTITVTPTNGFTGTVNLSCAVTTTPAGATSPATCGVTNSVNVIGATAANAIVTVNTTSTTTAGGYAVTVTGTAGSVTQTTVVGVTVTAFVPPPTFALGNSGTISVNPGATTGNTSTITITPTGGFTGSVTLSAALTSSPSGAANPPTFSFGTTSPVSISGATAGTGTLTVSTTPVTSGALVRPRDRLVPWYAAGSATLACLLFIGIPGLRRRWRTVLGMLILLAFLTGGIASCGGGGGGGGGKGNPGTTAGSYAITVTGTAGSTTNTTTVNLTVL